VWLHWKVGVLTLERRYGYANIQVRSGFVVEEEGSMFLRPVVTNVPDYTVS
jgi:hypothetical protein